MTYDEEFNEWLSSLSEEDIAWLIKEFETLPNAFKEYKRKK